MIEINAMQHPGGEICILRSLAFEDRVHNHLVYTQTPSHGDTMVSIMHVHTYKTKYFIFIIKLQMYICIKCMYLNDYFFIDVKLTFLYYLLAFLGHQIRPANRGQCGIVSDCKLKQCKRDGQWFDSHSSFSALATRQSVALNSTTQHVMSQKLNAVS